MDRRDSPITGAPGAAPAGHGGGARISLSQLLQRARRGALKLRWRVGVAARSASCALLGELPLADVEHIEIDAAPGARLWWSSAATRVLGGAASVRLVDTPCWRTLAQRTLRLHDVGVAHLLLGSECVVHPDLFKSISAEWDLRLNTGGIAVCFSRIGNVYTRGWTYADDGTPLIERVERARGEAFSGALAWPSVVVIGGPAWDGVDLPDPNVDWREWIDDVIARGVPVSEVWDTYVSYPDADSFALGDAPARCLPRVAVDIQEAPRAACADAISFATGGPPAVDCRLVIARQQRVDVDALRRYFAGIEVIDDCAFVPTWEDLTRTHASNYWWWCAGEPPTRDEAAALLDQLRLRRDVDSVVWRERGFYVSHGNLARWQPAPAGALSELFAVDAAAEFTPAAGIRVADRFQRPLCWNDAWPIARPAEAHVRVAVMSMCGVSSYQDKYGLGGEHQVVHWLREAFLEDPRVACCDLYDTANYATIPAGAYDLILSNSCWREAPKTRPGGVSIFWHFNTNSYQNATPQSVVSQGYDWIWTNSRTQLPEISRLMNGRAALVDLNASHRHHFYVDYDTPRFVHDVVYVGGYQAYYKGPERISRYLKPLIGHDDIDFAIYGNSLWRVAVQRDAAKRDYMFKQEYIDEAYEPHYRHVLHPDDFRHLARSAKIWINFNATDQIEPGMVNDRPIWAAACGAFIISDDTPQQREIFGDTIDYSPGGDDIAERVRYWLARPRERRERAMAARERVLALGLTTWHTAQRALRQLEEERGA